MPPRAQKVSQGHRDRAAIAKQLRDQDRRAIAALRAEVRALRGQRRATIKEIRGGCRAAIGQMREERAQLLSQAADLLARIRHRQERCKTYQRDADARILAKLEAEMEKLRAALAARHTERVWSTKAILRIDKARAAALRAQHAAEKRSESEDSVLANIPDELVPVFHKVKRGIRGTDRMSRTEAFMHWVHDHPAEVYEIQHAEHARSLAALEREERRMHREARRGARYRRTAPAMAADLDAIEF